MFWSASDGSMTALAPHVSPLSAQRPVEELFFRIILPVMAAVNFVLGMAVLVLVAAPSHVLGMVGLLVGGFCCAVAGWLAAAGWSKSFWARSMARQTMAWDRTARTILRWLEEMSFPAESLRRLDVSLAKTQADGEEPTAQS